MNARRINRPTLKKPPVAEAAALYGLVVEPLGGLPTVQQLLKRIQVLKTQVNAVKQRTNTRLKFDMAPYEYEVGGSAVSFSKHYHLPSESTKRDSKCTGVIASKLESQLTQLNIEETSLAEQRDFLRRKIEFVKDSSLTSLQEAVNDLSWQVDKARREFASRQSRTAELQQRNTSLTHQIDTLTVQLEKAKLEDIIEEELRFNEESLRLSELEERERTLRHLRLENEQLRVRLETPNYKQLKEQHVQLQREYYRVLEQFDGLRFRLDQLEKLGSTYRRQRKAMRAQISALRNQPLEEDSVINSQQSLQVSSNRSSSNGLLLNSLLSNNMKSIIRVSISKLEAEEGTNDNHLRAAKERFKKAKLEQFSSKFQLSRLMVEQAELQTIIAEQERRNSQLLKEDRQGLNTNEKHIRQDALNRRSNQQLLMELTKLEQQMIGLETRNEWLKGVLMYAAESQTSKVEEMVGWMEGNSRIEELFQEFIEQWLEVRNSCQQ